MRKTKNRRLLILPLLCLALVSSGCMFGGTRSYFDLVGPGMMSEFYRGEGVICTVPEPLESADGIIVGISFDFAVFGHSCEDQARKVLVTSGTGLVEDIERARLNQIAIVIGTFEGSEQQVLVAREIIIQRR